jgi:predicted alpha-1,6-mannanase (GH76 family)
MSKNGIYYDMAKAAAEGMQCFFETVNKFGINVYVYVNPETKEKYTWQTAISFEGIIDYMALSESTDYLDLVDPTFENAYSSLGLHSKDGNKPGYISGYKDQHTGYYDDEGWFALLWLKVHDMCNDVKFLNAAAEVFEDMTGGWETGTCDGGIWWTKGLDNKSVVHTQDGIHGKGEWKLVEDQYKAAIQNELFLLIAVRLYNNTKQDKYKSWFTDSDKHNAWKWFKDSTMINRVNLINSGLQHLPYCLNDQKPGDTYNQGVILGALVELHKSDIPATDLGIDNKNDLLALAQAIAQTVIYSMCYSNGVLQEPMEPLGNQNDDARTFKGIFMRYLGDMYRYLRTLDDVTLIDVKSRTQGLVAYKDLVDVNAPEYDTLKYYENFIKLNVESIWNKAKLNDNQFDFYWSGSTNMPKFKEIASVPNQASALGAFNAAIIFDELTER